MMITDSIGLYVHIPFCKKKCAYCDFASFPGVDLSTKEKYLDRLISEIKSYKREEKICVDTVFFGGGTPSLLSPSELSSILCAIKESFSVSSSAEISMEMNPGTTDKESLSAYLSAGVNRFSIGFQSLCDNELKKLGRIHNSADCYKAFFDAREAGCKNINIDIMYGIPEQTAESFSKTLSDIIKLSPEHISAYGLIIEEGTPFFDNRFSMTLPSEDEECDMYYFAIEALSLAGYNHYEISNYAKQGYECRHNLKYWHLSEYIGVGCAAHSFYGGAHYRNPSSLSEYFSLPVGEYLSDECLSAEDEAFEYAMMHLRLSEGFSLSEYREKFDADFSFCREALIKEYCERGYLIFEGDRIRLTERGFYVSNTILSALL